MPAPDRVRRAYGAPVNDEAEPSAGEVVPEADGVLAAALVAQGEAGVWALGLLRDVRRVLSGAGLEQPAEVAERG
ncbi:hypothetical protein [Streptomyces sp. NPDC093589]|uniref:hypothetical protein n=1 Tax=Streptomyces sp. NPDC093589 TaxID=3366043 RepID=UPI0037F9368C